MGLGFELAVATVYIVEIASTDMRGILGILANGFLSRGSSINDVSQFLIIFDTPSPIVTFFSNKALALLSQNP